jgi:hypothetical protein
MESNGDLNGLSADDLRNWIVARLLKELSRLPSAVELDDLDCEIYAECATAIRTHAEALLVVKALRSRCKFRPIAIELREIIESVIPPADTAYDRQNKREARKWIAANNWRYGDEDGNLIGNASDAGLIRFER